MMRNDQGGVDSHDGHLSALLAALSIPPTLPPDAPQQLRDLTIDVVEPKKIYSIYRGSRRHNFEILVERFIVQLRFGCQNVHCTTPTCFTCRRRAAGSRPLRRYNATSARTLACYLASLDNPETNLCQYGRANPVKLPSKPPSKVTLKSNVLASGSRTEFESSRDPRTHKSSKIREPLSPKTVARLTTSLDMPRPADDDTASETSQTFVQALQEPVKTDHKSFVQNLFGTVAFKMVEWLTPFGLEHLAAGEVDGLTRQSDELRVNQDKRLSTPSSASGMSRDEQDFEAKANGSAVLTPADLPSVLHDAQNTVVGGSCLDQSHKMLPNGRSESGKLRRLSLTTHSSIGRESTEHQRHKSTSESKSSTAAIARNLSIIASQESASGPPTFQQTPASRSSNEESAMPADKGTPQSLSKLPLEVINIVCDFLEEYVEEDAYRIFSLLPCPGRVVRKYHNTANEHKSSDCDLKAGTKIKYSHTTRRQWHDFLEQSLFYVLSQPNALLQSFRNPGQELYDSQTIWHCMMRLSRASWPLVFDGLWLTLGHLYVAPQTTRSLLDSSKSQNESSEDDMFELSAGAKSDILYVCLHALIAAGPQVENLSDLVAVSRNRSKGLISFRGRPWSKELLNFSLIYDDAFSDELVQRFARRLFGAIPVLRQYQELLRLNSVDLPGHIQASDVLDIVLSRFAILDIDASPFLNFTTSERELYGKQGPILLLDWARTIMLQDWKGTAEIPADGAFGGALSLIAAIYKLRNDLSLPDVYFRTERFADRLDDVDMPVEWLSFTADAKTSHLLEHPYLFSPTKLVTYFRSINFFRMSQAYEASNTAQNKVDTISSPGRLMLERSRDHLLKRLSVAVNPYLVLQIRRTHVLEDAFDQLWRREERELTRPLKIHLGEDDGEEGFDSGGVQQEFFRLAVAEALNPEYGAFTVDEKSRMIWFQPGSPQPLWKFELIGIIVSLAVFNGLTLPVTFPKAFYRKLLGAPVTDLHHIADGWLELCKNLNFLLEWDEKQHGSIRENLGRTYEYSVAAFGKAVSREMLSGTRWPQFSETQLSQDFEMTSQNEAPNVRDVDIDNRHDYVTDYIKWLTDVSVRPQFEAFQKGFNACLSQRSLTLLDPDVLQSIVEGIQDIDISELRRYARYEGYSPSDRIIKEFWSIVKKYSQEEKKKLLEFVTASDRLPVGGMRNVVFVIQKNGGAEMDGHLPTSYTCYGYLLLPEYSKKEILREKLEMALENSKGFGFA